MCSVHWAKVAAPGYHDYLLLLSMLFFVELIVIIMFCFLYSLHKFVN